MVLQSVKEDVYIKARDIVSSVDISIKLMKPGKKKSQQCPLRALCRYDTSTISLANSRLIGPLYLILEAYTVMLSELEKISAQNCLLAA